MDMFSNMVLEGGVAASHRWLMAAHANRYKILELGYYQRLVADGGVQPPGFLQK
jgi:hypothetical protein